MQNRMHIVITVNSARNTNRTPHPCHIYIKGFTIPVLACKKWYPNLLLNYFTTRSCRVYWGALKTESYSRTSVRARKERLVQRLTATIIPMQTVLFFYGCEDTHWHNVSPIFTNWMPNTTIYSYSNLIPIFTTNTYKVSQSLEYYLIITIYLSYVFCLCACACTCERQLLSFDQQH